MSFLITADESEIEITFVYLSEIYTSTTNPQNSNLQFFQRALNAFNKIHDIEFSFPESFNDELTPTFSKIGEFCFTLISPSNTVTFSVFDEDNNFKIELRYLEDKSVITMNKLTWKLFKTEVEKFGRKCGKQFILSKMTKINFYERCGKLIKEEDICFLLKHLFFLLKRLFFVKTFVFC